MQCIQNMFFTNNFKQKCVILNKKKWRKHGNKEKQLSVSLMLLLHSDIICDLLPSKDSNMEFIWFTLYRSKNWLII